MECRPPDVANQPSADLFWSARVTDKALLARVHLSWYMGSRYLCPATCCFSPILHAARTESAAPVHKKIQPPFLFATLKLDPAIHASHGYSLDTAGAFILSSANRLSLLLQPSAVLRITIDSGFFPFGQFHRNPRHSLFQPGPSCLTSTTSVAPMRRMPRSRSFKLRWYVTATSPASHLPFRPMGHLLTFVALAGHRSR